MGDGDKVDKFTKPSTKRIYFVLVRLREQHQLQFMHVASSTNSLACLVCSCLLSVINPSIMHKPGYKLYSHECRR